MSTPTSFGLPTPNATAIEDALHKLQKERDAQTPEMDCFAHFKHDYKYICEQEHQPLTLARVDRLRSSITDAKYHEIEVDFYRSVYAQIVHDKLLSKYITAQGLTLEGLRGLKASYRQMLAANGLTGNTLREKRLEITNQDYWRPEAEVLQQNAALRQHNELAKLARDHSASRTRSGLGKPVPKATRRSPRIAKRIPNLVQSISKTPLEPRTRRVIGRVAKRKGEGSPKPHQA